MRRRGEPAYRARGIVGRVTDAAYPGPNDKHAVALRCKSFPPGGPDS